MDGFMEKFRAEKYKGAFSEDNWEEEFDKIPMFMKNVPENIDPEKVPELACLQSMLRDPSPEEQAGSCREDGNQLFREKKYQEAVAAYTEGIKMASADPELNAVLYTNRAAAQFYLGNYRSSLNDAIAARKQKEDHLKAVIRGALCYMEMKKFSEALTWCDEGLQISPTEKKLLETRAKADKLHRAAERDARKMRQAEKKTQVERESLLRAIQDRGIKLLDEGEQEEDEETSGTWSDGISSSENVTGARVVVGDDGRLRWPVLFFYPEHNQSDFISAFHEDSRFLDHLQEMFSQDSPPWDTDRKYRAQDLEIFFEDETSQSFQQVNPKSSLLQALQQRRFHVRAGTPSFLVLVKGSVFCRKYFSDKTLHRLH